VRAVARGRDVLGVLRSVPGLRRRAGRGRRVADQRARGLRRRRGAGHRRPGRPVAAAGAHRAAPRAGGDHRPGGRAGAERTIAGPGVFEPGTPQPGAAAPGTRQPRLPEPSFPQPGAAAPGAVALSAVPAPTASGIVPALVPTLVTAPAAVAALGPTRSRRRPRPAWPG